MEIRFKSWLIFIATFLRVMIESLKAFKEEGSFDAKYAMVVYPFLMVSAVLSNDFLSAFDFPFPSLFSSSKLMLVHIPCERLVLTCHVRCLP